MFVEGISLCQAIWDDKREFTHDKGSRKKINMKNLNYEHKKQLVQQIKEKKEKQRANQVSEVFALTNTVL